MSGLATVVTFLFAVGFLGGTLGYLARQLSTLLGFTLLALFLGQHVFRDMFVGFPRRWSVWLLAVAALVGVFYSTGWIQILFVSLLVGGVARLQSAEARQRAEMRVIQTTAFAYGLFLWFWRETAAGCATLCGRGYAEVASRGEGGGMLHGLELCPAGMRVPRPRHRERWRGTRRGPLVTEEARTPEDYSRSYGYDLAGKRTSKTTDGVLFTYTYDDSGKLTSLTGGGTSARPDVTEVELADLV